MGRNFYFTDWKTVNIIRIRIAIEKWYFLTFDFECEITFDCGPVSTYNYIEIYNNHVPLNLFQS